MTSEVNDSLHKRGRAVEDAFFRNVDDELLRKMRSDAERAVRRDELLRYSGIPDSPLIDDLLDRGFTPSSLAALMLLPAVIVAWADGTVQPTERQAIFHAVLDRRFGETDEIRELVEAWLKDKPGKDLWSLWQAFATAVYDSIPPEQAGDIAERVRELAVDVAEAAGGMFNRGTISAEEQLILDEIDELR